MGGYSDLQTSGSGLLSTHEEHIGFSLNRPLYSTYPTACGTHDMFPPFIPTSWDGGLHRRESLQRAKLAYPSKHCLTLLPDMRHWLLGPSEELNRSYRLTQSRYTLYLTFFFFHISSLLQELLEMTYWQDIVLCCVLCFSRAWVGATSSRLLTVTVVKVLTVNSLLLS